MWLFLTSRIAADIWKNQTNMYYISFLLIIESIIRTVIFLYLVKTTPGVTITWSEPRLKRRNRETEGAGIRGRELVIARCWIIDGQHLKRQEDVEWLKTPPRW